MKHGITQGIETDRLDLTDLLEISDLFLSNQAVSLRVAGWSMYPALRKGDQLTVEPVSPTSLQVGDVILFHQCGQLICHRVVALDTAGPGTQIITKGDAAAGYGETIQSEQVLGRVVAIRRSGGWWRVLPAFDILAMRIDRGRERLTNWLGQGLGRLQGLRPYRRLMWTMFSGCFSYYAVIPEGRWGSRVYKPIRLDGYPVIAGHRAYHLLAKLAGICVGSLQVTASGEGYWIEHLYVRIRYRGLGVSSHLLALAATAAAVSGARVLLASVEPANTAALHLFMKAGFRETGGLRGNEVSLRRDL